MRAPLAALVMLIGTIGGAGGLFAQAASAAGYACQNNSFPYRYKSARVAAQDGDGVWHYASYTIRLAGSASNTYQSSCGATTRIMADYGVDGRSLRAGGFGWTARASYLNPNTNKYVQMSRQYSGMSGGYNSYHDENYVALYGKKVTSIRLAFTATYGGRVWGSNTITCNLLNNTCS